MLLLLPPPILLHSSPIHYSTFNSRTDCTCLPLLSPLLSSLPYHSSLPFFLPFVSFRSVPFRSLHCTALHCICAAPRRAAPHVHCISSPHLTPFHFTSLQCRVSEIGRDWQRNGFVRADHEAYSCPPPGIALSCLSSHRSSNPALTSGPGADWIFRSELEMATGHAPSALQFEILFLLLLRRISAVRSCI